MLSFSVILTIVGAYALVATHLYVMHQWLRDEDAPKMAQVKASPERRTPMLMPNTAPALS